MAKGQKPAFFFYASDWLTSTREMTAEERGYYVDMLAYQWVNQGINEERMNRIFPGVEKVWEYLQDKFQKDPEDGLLKNARLEEVRFDMNETSRKRKEAREKREKKKQDQLQDANKPPAKPLQNSDKTSTKESEGESEGESISNSKEEGGMGGEDPEKIHEPYWTEVKQRWDYHLRTKCNTTITAQWQGESADVEHEALEHILTKIRAKIETLDDTAKVGFPEQMAEAVPWFWSNLLDRFEDWDPFDQKNPRLKFINTQFESICKTIKDGTGKDKHGTDSEKLARATAAKLKEMGLG